MQSLAGHNLTQLWGASFGQVGMMQSHHRVYIEVYILDNNRNYLANASEMLVDGSIDIDVYRTPSRQGTLTLLDPAGTLGLDGNPNSGIVAYNRMVKIVMHIGPMDGQWASQQFDLFTGPIVTSDRSGPFLNIEFGGCELYSTQGMPYDWTWPVGWSKTSVISNALLQHSGEVYQDFELDRHPLIDNWSVQTGENLWVRLQDLAEEVNCRLWYDANGVAKLRRKNWTPVWTFDQFQLTGDPSVKFDMDKMRNYVVVLGATPEGSTRVRYDAVPPVNHPYSPQSLARNGFARYIPDVIEDDQLDFPSAADRAWSRLSEAILTSMDVNLTSCIVPFLEEWDCFSVNHKNLWMPQALFTKATIPLVGDAEMSVGFLSTSSQGESHGSSSSQAPIPPTVAGKKTRMDTGGAAGGFKGGPGAKKKNKPTKGPWGVNKWPNQSKKKKGKGKK
jgi:hypothetical protein